MLYHFWVKIQNKCVHPVKKDPIELLKDSRATNCFSEKDHAWIIEITLENQKRLIENKFKKSLFLVNHQFSEQMEEPLIVYKDADNRLYIKPAKEIYSNIEKLKLFSSEDCACIGNLVGSHETEQELQLKLKYQQKNNVVKFDTSSLSGS